MYSIDGSSHSTGVKTEKNLAERLRSGAAKELYPLLSEDFKVIGRGGTRYKQDVEIVDGDEKILISAKKKEDVSKGSFDWVNSSSATKTIEPLRVFAETVKEIGNTCNIKGTAKLGVMTAAHQALSNLTSNEVSTILRDHVATKNDGMKIIISETSTGSNWEYSFEDSPLYDAIQNHTPKVMLGNGIDSAKVVFQTKDGETIDHGIRIRIVTNNGISALIGQSKANKSSIGVVKIQQDNISGLISGLGNKIRKF